MLEHGVIWRCGFNHRILSWVASQVFCSLPSSQEIGKIQHWSVQVLSTLSTPEENHPTILVLHSEHETQLPLGPRAPWQLGPLERRDQKTGFLVFPEKLRPTAPNGHVPRLPPKKKKKTTRKKAATCHPRCSFKSSASKPLPGPCHTYAASKLGRAAPKLLAKHKWFPLVHWSWVPWYLKLQIKFISTFGNLLGTFPYGPPLLCPKNHHQQQQPFSVTVLASKNNKNHDRRPPYAARAAIPKLMSSGFSAAESNDIMVAGSSGSA